MVANDERFRIPRCPDCRSDAFARLLSISFACYWRCSRCGGVWATARGTAEAPSSRKPRQRTAERRRHADNA